MESATKIKALGDGNCAFNAFVLGLFDLAQAGLLESGIHRQTRTTIVALWKKAKNISPEKINWENFKNYLNQQDTAEKLNQMQRDFAPFMRELAIDLAEDNFEDCIENSFPRLLTAYEDFKHNNQQEDVFLPHAFIKEKFSYFKEHTKNNQINNQLKRWWRDEGLKIFLSKMRKDGKWAGDFELTLLAEHFKVNIDLKRNRQRLDGYYYHGELPIKQLSNGLSKEKLSKLYGVIIEGGAENNKRQLYYRKLNEEILKQELNKLVESKVLTKNQSKLIYDSWSSFPELSTLMLVNEQAFHWDLRSSNVWLKSLVESLIIADTKKENLKKRKIEQKNTLSNKKRHITDDKEDDSLIREITNLIYDSENKINFIENDYNLWKEELLSKATKSRSLKNLNQAIVQDAYLLNYLEECCQDFLKEYPQHVNGSNKFTDEIKKYKSSLESNNINLDGDRPLSLTSPSYTRYSLSSPSYSPTSYYAQSSVNVKSVFSDIGKQKNLRVNKNVLPTTHLEKYAIDYEAEINNRLNDLETWIGPGISSYRQKKFREAIRYFKKATELKNNFTVSYLYLCEIYKNLLNCTEAVKYLGLALKNEPDLSRTDFKYYKLLDVLNFINRFKNFPRDYITAISIDSNFSIETNSHTNINAIINKLITRLLYIAHRKNWKDDECEKIRKYICFISPKFISYSRKNFNDYIRSQEEKCNTYFGSYLSDDSDSEDEKEIQNNNHILPIDYKVTNEEIGKFKDLLNKIFPKLEIYAPAKIVKKFQANFPLPKRQELHYEADDDLKEAKTELKLLNAELKKDKSLNKVVGQLNTQFYIAQYRGITYFMDKWDQAGRQYHRELDETYECNYSEGVYHSAGFKPLSQFFKPENDTLQNRRKLHSNALKLKGKIEILQNAENPDYKSQKYDNYKILLQEIYTRNDSHFAELIHENKALKAILKNEGNPLVSTADTPYHALRYAYGLKTFPHKRKIRLQPRWNSDGRAERPKVGKCCGFLMPLGDYNSIENPSHIPSLLFAGKIFADNTISAERETSFDAFIDKDRLFTQHVAKYPSFNKPYKKIYLEQYGMDEGLYEWFKSAIKTTQRHTNAWKNLKILLGEWLCFYYEMQFVRAAQSAARRKNGFIVYHDIGKNQFTFTIPPYTPNKNFNSVSKAQKKAAKANLAKNKTTYHDRPTWKATVVNKEESNTNDNGSEYNESGMSQLIREFSLQSTESQSKNSNLPILNDGMEYSFSENDIEENYSGYPMVDMADTLNDEPDMLIENNTNSFKHLNISNFNNNNDKLSPISPTKSNGKVELLEAHDEKSLNENESIESESEQNFDLFRPG